MDTSWPKCLCCGSDLDTCTRWSIRKLDGKPPDQFIGLFCPKGCDQHAFVATENKAAVMAILGIEEKGTE